jgi:hypothetical protein
VSVGEHNADQYRYDEAYVDYLDVTSPAAGLNASTVVPGQFGFRVLAALATLTTAAAVANRLVSLDVINANSVTRLRNPAPASIPANTTNQRYVWNAAYATGASITNGPMVVPVNDLLVPASWSIQITVDNVQAADQLASVSLIVLKVPTGL